ncbi:HAMP domain-containing protein [Psychromonas sp. RZ22]|uniref:ATP-binding protein n=1 Tax=Psychromonas algarum TaxID=2555643 RepID=UPI0010677E79|nr:ATP-binding protein [Psychromonas sp. RZ22]TEW55591.1 HAMP domain-containing protein [Psychromonas sp. RZ22]
MKLKFLNSLFVRIFGTFWLLILLLTTAIILLPNLDTRNLQPITSSDLEDLKLQQQNIDHFVARSPQVDLMQLLETDPLKSAHQIYLTTTKGRLINDSAPAKMRNFIANSDDPNRPLKKINLQKTYLGPIQIEIQGKSHYLYIALLNQKKSLELTEWLIDKPLLLLLVALIISTPICAYIAWYFTQPLQQLKQATIQVSKGKLDTPFPDIKRSEEMNELAYSIQLMVTSLKNMLKNQKRLLSDISHELRSPLTRLNLALAITKKQDGENKALERIQIEAERMEIMIGEMLDISRIQLNEYELEHIPLHTFFEDLFLDAEFEAQENGKKFTYPDLTSNEIIKNEISVFYELAYRAIENVIRNAIKYAKYNIITEILIEEKNISITIRNDGPLIPQSELESIFKPFYRIHESRERETGGAGLGLSIAQNAMLRHQGEIWAENKDGQVHMILQFPRITKQ